MPNFERTTSVLSCSSADTLANSTCQPEPTRPQGEIPFVRRRLLHEQTVALLAMFDHKTHPSKEERTALAEELGLELKTISAWFQNRRRSIKKKSLIWRRNAQENRYGSGTGQPSAVSVISLDCVASAHERPSYTRPESPVRSPLTPRRVNTSRRYFSPEKPENIWDHIPSSPPVQPSSPTAESVRIAALPKRSKTLRSLEWACAKARAGRIIEEEPEEDDWDVPMLVLDKESRHGRVDNGEETEAEEYEAITPDVSAVHLTPIQLSPGSLTNQKKSPLSGDMEAAMALLGFMGRRSLGG